MVGHFVPNLILPDQKIEQRILPFLSFPITTNCNLHCIYCGEGGEATASFQASASLGFVSKHTIVGYKYGIRKFRLTGGEPTTHPKFEGMVEFISALEGVTLLINTNSTKIRSRRGWIFRLKPNVKFAVSLDALKPDLFGRMNASRGRFKDVMDGIRILTESGNLYRINMVVTKLNQGEVFSLIDFCQHLGCNLKVLEVSSVPIPYNNWQDLYVPLDPIEDELVKQAVVLESHQYSRGFGIPMPIYQIGNVHVTVKSSRYGAHYDKDGICKGCQYYPCHEGLYDLYLIPDGRLCGCRWSEISVAKGDTFFERLVYLAEAFQRAEWVNREQMRAMPPMPPFVQHARAKRGRSKSTPRSL